MSLWPISSWMLSSPRKQPDPPTAMRTDREGVDDLFK